LAERSDTLNSVSFARRKAGIFLPAASVPELVSFSRFDTVVVAR
jgi:hypothetical protein